MLLLAQLFFINNHYYFFDIFFIAAKVTALTALFLTVFLSGFTSYLFYYFRNLLGYLFTSDVDVIHRCSQLADIFAALQFVNSIQGTSQGIMRGMSRQKELFGYTFFCYWILGLPLGIISYCYA